MIENHNMLMLAHGSFESAFAWAGVIGMAACLAGLVSFILSMVCRNRTPGLVAAYITIGLSAILVLWVLVKLDGRFTSVLLAAAPGAFGLFMVHYHRQPKARPPKNVPPPGGPDT